MEEWWRPIVQVFQNGCRNSNYISSEVKNKYSQTTKRRCKSVSWNCHSLLHEEITKTTSAWPDSSPVVKGKRLWCCLDCWQVRWIHSIFQMPWEESHDSVLLYAWGWGRTPILGQNRAWVYSAWWQSFNAKWRKWSITNWRSQPSYRASAARFQWTKARRKAYI